MKIGIIGSGMIGSTFGNLFTRAGHQIMFSSRHPDHLQELVNENDALAGTPEEACNWGDVILLAVPFKAVPDLGKKHNPQLKNKILIDATNPFPERDGEIASTVIDHPDLSSSEVTQKYFSNALVVKAFNATYFKVFLSEAFKEGDDRLAVPLAGDNEISKGMAMSLIEDIGMAPFAFGALKNGKKFEPDTPVFNANIKIKDAPQKWGEFL